MSLWGLRWFGGSAKKDIAKDAILGLRSQLELLSKREKHLQYQVDEQEALAKKYVSSNRNAAKAALRRKKNFELSLEQMSSQILALEREVYSIEAANINKETLNAMQNAGKAMSHIHGGMTIDKVDKAMETLREQHAVGEEINEAISGSIEYNAVDDDDLDRELKELQQQQLDEAMLKTDRAPSLSDALLTHGMEEEVKGKTPVRVEEEDEEEELRKLQEEMAQ